MGQWDIDTGYEMLMSPTPYSQASASVMIRNFGTAAQLMATELRSAGATASSGGSAGAAAQLQAERHAQWFDEVAANSAKAADQLDTLATVGNQHQQTAATVYSSYQAAVAADSRPGAMGGQDMAVIREAQTGSDTLSTAVNEWGQSYAAFKAPAPPPVPSSGGAPSGTGGGSDPTGGGGSTGGPGSYAARVTNSGGDPTLLAPTSTASGGRDVGSPVLDRGPGVTGSIEVGPDGGEFAGWYKDPTTGYYVDPQSGREFDPASSRWVDPVTGEPFGDVSKYATSLQGLGPASTTGGLLTDTAASVDGGIAGLSGAGGAAGLAGATGIGGSGSFAGLFAGGNLAAVSGAYGGTLPPSLSSGSAGVGSLFTQGSRNLAVKAAAAESLIAREQAARAGRPYLPPTQAGGVGAGAGAGSRTRPSYLSAEEEEAALFSSPGRTGALGRGVNLGATAAAEAEAEAEAAAAARAGMAAEEEGLVAGGFSGAGSPVGMGSSSAFGARFGSGAGAPEPVIAGGRGSASRASSAVEAEEGAVMSRRPYLPPAQAGTGGAEKKGKRERPGWLVDDDVFDADDAPSGVLGD